ncbi:MAG: type II secretion system GspH family protein, partial [Puniceicoccales bacterium]|nr:type II secretion system GspH family protein [Puniceicoccales bacterium]
MKKLLPDLTTPSRISGMTLIEMMTVVSIMLILMMIIVPAVNSARLSVMQKQGQMQFQRFIHALRDYYAEYQTYPPFLDTTEAVAALNPFGLYSSGGENSKNFIRALTGKEPGGAELSAGSLYLNPKRLVFLEIVPEDLFKTPTGDRDENQIADIFNNTQIFIVAENPSDQDRRIPQSLFTGIHAPMQAYVPAAGLLSDLAIWSIDPNDSK